MKILSKFRFKSWHFILMFVALVMVVNVLGAIQVKRIPQYTINARFSEIDENYSNHNNISQVSVILCYKKNSDLCDKMEYNLDQLSYDENIKYYKLDVDKYPEKGLEYNVSGVPSVLILKDGKQIERVIGVVSVSNLEIILKRISKQIEKQ